MLVRLRILRVELFYSVHSCNRSLTVAETGDRPAQGAERMGLLPKV